MFGLPYHSRKRLMHVRAWEVGSNFWGEKRVVQKRHICLSEAPLELLFWHACQALCLQIWSAQHIRCFLLGFRDDDLRNWLNCLRWYVTVTALCLVPWGFCYGSKISATMKSVTSVNSFVFLLEARGRVSPSCVHFLQPSDVALFICWEKHWILACLPIVAPVRWWRRALVDTEESLDSSQHWSLSSVFLLFPGPLFPIEEFSIRQPAK